VVATVSAEKRELFVSVGKARGLNVQQTAVAVIDAYIASGGATVPEPGSPTAEEKLWIRKLLDLLRSSDQARIEMVTFALDSHAREERTKRKQAG